MDIVISVSPELREATAEVSKACNHTSERAFETQFTPLEDTRSSGSPEQWNGTTGLRRKRHYKTTKRVRSADRRLTIPDCRCRRRHSRLKAEIPVSPDHRCTVN